MEQYQYSKQERAALEALRQPFAVYQFLNRRVVTLLLSDGFCRLFGYEDKAQAYYDMDHNMYKDTHPDDAARIANAAFHFATQGGSYEVLYRTRVRDSANYRIVHAFGEHVLTDTGVQIAQVWYTDEGIYEEDSSPVPVELSATLRSALREESLLKASHYDYLTGLPNMTYFFELADAGKAAMVSRGAHPVVMYMDFMGMKFYNTKYGFAEGDRLLRAFADVLKHLFSNENCCRIGGDHFAVHTESEGLDDRLQELFRACPELNEGKSLPIHVGIYRSRIEKLHASVALDRAKLACTALKGRYETAANYYSQSLSDDAQRRQYVIEHIDEAIEQGWIQVYYQPIVRAVNEKVCDEEALARWMDPVRGMLSPAEFIPALEDSSLIYKLDLHVLDQVLEKMRFLKDEGLPVVPHSVNLSRSDFNSCDIVEEIRRRVDEAGIDRDRITIEITESIIGSNQEFMKEQIYRFRTLGFPVWMDDFGSGYSSLDVLQSIKFDLIKFDMSFMRKLREGNSARIVLTELMKMAASLGVDTVCEGVETQEQARFLQEVGCSKLQGYYYCKPIPFATILESIRGGFRLGYENPEESGYFETVGRINLFDLGAIANESEHSLHNTFSTLPMGIVEIRDGHTRFVRYNQSYRDFIQRFFHVDLSTLGTEFGQYNTAFIRHFEKSRTSDGDRLLFNERTSSGCVVHSFTRRIGTNPTSGGIAVAVAILSISEPDENATYADIALALTTDFYKIYVVDLETERYTEYSSPVGAQGITVERQGSDFFAMAAQLTAARVYQQDQDRVRKAFTREHILRALEAQGVFNIACRLTNGGKPTCVNIKITRMPEGKRIIVGISIGETGAPQENDGSALRTGEQR